MITQETEFIRGSAASVTPKGITVPISTQEAKPSVPLAQSFPRAELGDSGTRLLRGIITEEYNPQLQGVQGIRIYDEMRKSDGTVRAAVIVCTLPIRRAKYFVNPATDSQQDQDIANFVSHALFDWIEDMTWDDIVRQALLMVPFGVMLFEKVYTTKEHEGKTYVTLKKLAPRLPKSILQWELTDGTFGIQQIRQDGQLPQIPGSKLLIFVNEREGDNWWGTSMLRAAYKHWYIKNTFYKIDNIAFERQGLGVPMIEMPIGYTESDEKKAKQALQNLRASENAYMIVPNGYKASFMDMGSRTTRDPQNSIEHHNKEILQSVLAQFLELGATKSGSGSRALSQDHSDLFLKAMEAIAFTLVSEFNKSLIPEIVNLNFNDVQVYPVLDYSGISKVDVTSLGTAYAQLVTAGAITPTDDDQQYLRAAMGLPPRDEADIEKETEEDPSSEEQEDGADIEDPNEDTVDTAATTTAEKPQITKQKKQVDNATAKKKASEQRLQKFTSGDGFVSWRPLTFSEEKVNWKKIQDMMDKFESSFTEQANALLSDAKDSFMTKMQVAITAGDTKGMQELELNFVNAYKQLLKETMRDAYTYGKNNAATEIGAQIPPNTADTLANIDLVADTIANKTASDLESKAKIAAASALKNDTNPLQASGLIDAAIQNAAEKSVDSAASIIVGQGVNNGRNDVFERNASDIYALQRSEVLDEKTCDFCLSMDGRIVDTSDQWAKTDIFHSSCRGIWVAILTNEQNPPDIGGVPESLGDYYDGQTNSLIQPPKPIVDKYSPAAKYIAKRDAAKEAKRK